MIITDEAVDTVGKQFYVYWDSVNPRTQEQYRSKVRKALEEAFKDIPDASPKRAVVDYNINGDPIFGNVPIPVDPQDGQ